MDVARPHRAPGHVKKSCETDPKPSITGAINKVNPPYLDGNTLADDNISELARQAIGILSNEFAAVSDDALRTAALRQAIEILGRPSGSSPPQPDASALKLPVSPPAWWRNRAKDDTPEIWIKTHYKQYLDANIGLTRGFFQRKGQDKAFATALFQWEKKGNKLPTDLYIPTKSELITQQLEQMSGTVKAAPRPYVSTPEVRQAARLYQAARSRRLE